MTNVIPRSLFISDIRTLDAMAIGGFGAVFKGEYAGMLVALKVLNKVRHQEVSLTPRPLNTDTLISCEELIPKRFLHRSPCVAIDFTSLYPSLVGNI